MQRKNINDRYISSKENKGKIFTALEELKSIKSYYDKNLEISHESSVVLVLFFWHGCLSVWGCVRSVESVPSKKPVNDATGHDVTCLIEAWSNQSIMCVGCVDTNLGWEITTSHDQSPENLGCEGFNFKKSIHQPLWQETKKDKLFWRSYSAALKICIRCSNWNTAMWPGFRKVHFWYERTELESFLKMFCLSDVNWRQFLLEKDWKTFHQQSLRKQRGQNLHPNE